MLCSCGGILVVRDYDDLTGDTLLFGYCTWVFVKVFILFGYFLYGIRDQGI